MEAQTSRKPTWNPKGPLFGGSYHGKLHGLDVGEWRTLILIPALLSPCLENSATYTPGVPKHFIVGMDVIVTANVVVKAVLHIVARFPLGLLLLRLSLLKPWCTSW